MARHRNVRSMNYSDEYDGYDDVYGHSVEDEYCISPSDEAQFMYDRTRQPQISAFFSEQDNITEEDESLEQTNDRKNSDCFIRPTLSDLEEAKLRSCLEEIRNVIGDSISEKILVETVLKCDFNVNKSLDTILSNATSSNEIISEDPKPQRVRRERDRDFINFQSDLQCKVNSRVLKQLSDNINAIELRDSEQNTCQDDSFNKKSLEDISNKLTAKQNQAAACSSIPELYEQRSQFCRITNKNLSLDYNSSLPTCNILTLVPSREIVNDNNQLEKNKLEVQIGDSVQIGGVSSCVRVHSCSSILISKGISGEKMEKQKNLSEVDTKLHVSLCDNMEVDVLNSSDEECGSSPLVLLAKQLAHTGKGDHEKQHSNLLPRSSTQEEKETKDQCQAFRNLTIRESGLQSVDFLPSSKGVSGIHGSVGGREGQADGGSCHETDNSDDENSPFSPLAALANRHHKHKSAESYLSEEKKIQPISTRKNEGNLSGKRGLGNILRPNSSESSYKDKKMSSSSCTSRRDCILIDKSSDDEESTFSPLAALADKFNRGKGDSSSRSDLSSSSSVASGLDQKCSRRPAGCSSAELMSGNEEGKGKITKILCRCKSESDSYSSSSPSCTSMCINVSGGTCCRDQCGSQRYIQCCDSEPVGDVPLFSSAISNDRKSRTQKKSASSLSDLAFFHLTRSASCGMKSDHELTNKRIQSDTGISKSVPGGFVIPFLKQEGYEHGIWKNSSTEKQEEKEIEMNVESSDDEWVIDLSNAIRDPCLRLSDNVAILEEEMPAQVIDVCNVDEVQKISYAAPCILDASELLKMRFSHTKRRCSSFGKVLCRQWRELARPYVPPRKPYTGDLVHFAFDEKSPDDKVFSVRNAK